MKLCHAALRKSVNKPFDRYAQIYTHCNAALHFGNKHTVLRVKYDLPMNSGVAKGGQVGARAPGRRSWGRTSTLFAVI